MDNNELSRAVAEAAGWTVTHSNKDGRYHARIRDAAIPETFNSANEAWAAVLMGRCYATSLDAIAAEEKRAGLQMTTLNLLEGGEWNCYVLDKNLHGHRGIGPTEPIARCCAFLAAKGVKP